MRKVGGNDIWELYRATHGDAQKPLLWHEIKRLDTRADMVCRFVQSWGMAAAFSEMMVAMHAEAGKPAPKPVSIEDVVTRAAELVEQIWFECERRGWMLEAPSLEDDP